MLICLYLFIDSWMDWAILFQKHLWYLVYKALTEFILLTFFKMVQVIVRPFYMVVVQPLSEILVPESSPTTTHVSHIVPSPPWVQVWPPGSRVGPQWPMSGQGKMVTNVLICHRGFYDYKNICVCKCCNHNLISDAFNFELLEHIQCSKINLFPDFYCFSE